MGGDSVPAIHGWGCTPTSETGLAPVNTNNQNQAKCLPVHIARGWQRTTLYLILAILIIIVFINIALTLWIIAILRLSMVNLHILLLL